jgi:hypothetical protein
MELPKSLIEANKVGVTPDLSDVVNLSNPNVSDQTGEQLMATMKELVPEVHPYTTEGKDSEGRAIYKFKGEKKRFFVWMVVEGSWRGTQEGDPRTYYFGTTKMDVLREITFFLVD